VGAAGDPSTVADPRRATLVERREGHAIMDRCADRWFCYPLWC